MIPEKGDTYINIPITFDKQSKGRILTKQKFLVSALIFGVQFFICVMCWIAGPVLWKILFPIIGLTLWSLITRFILLRERYFKAKRAELREKDYLFGSSVFWNIASIDEAYPYFVRFGNGSLGLFVAFDKDVIVGKPEDNDYYHYEAISEAYKEMAKRGIYCMHIDYMDVCGKDDRMIELFKIAANTENPDLKLALTRFYDNIENLMNRAYACYDVYCFYSHQRDDLFWDDVQGVIGLLNQANFIRSRILDREELGILAKALFNIDDFSVMQACDYIYKEQSTNWLKPIWVERDGKRTILNKTSEELEEVRRVTKAERKLKKVKRNKQEEYALNNEDISLWGTETQVANTQVEQVNKQSVEQINKQNEVVKVGQKKATKKEKKAKQSSEKVVKPEVNQQVVKKQDDTKEQKATVKKVTVKKRDVVNNADTEDSIDLFD